MAKNTVEIRYVRRSGRGDNAPLKYRRTVPPDVRDKLKRANWTKTFRRGTPLALVEQKARRLAAEHDLLIDRARAGETLSPEVIAEAEAQAREWLRRDRAETFEALAYLATEPTPSDQVFINAMGHGGRYVPEGISLSAVYQRDLELYGQDRSEKPIAAAVDSFIAIVGDKEVTKINRGDVAEWLGKLSAKGLAPGTIQRRIGALRAIVNRAFLDLEHGGANPFAKQSVKGGNGRSDDRLPFNRKMLQRIDSHLVTNKRVQHETRNIIQLMKGTGTGPAEIGGLVLADVILDGEIPFIWVRANNIRGLKTAVRDRQIPLIGDALEAAQDARKRAGVRSKGKNLDAVPLFLGFGASGRGADSISAKINKCLRAAGVPKSKRLVAYSFRHTMKEALRSAAVVDHVQRRLLGHTGQGVADRYGAPRARLSEAREALTAAIEHLGDVDESIYSTKERLKG